jgi:hypothetical protein
MALYTERSNAQLTVATDCTDSLSDRNNNKDASGATEAHSVLLKNFCRSSPDSLQEM